MILGIDPGGRRYGVALADLATRFARPLEVIDAEKDDPVVRLVELARMHDVDRVVVGKPVTLAGAEGAAVEAQRKLVAALRAADLDVVEYDERLTTVVAERALRASGAKRVARRKIKDAVAAQVMLQNYVDSLQSSPPAHPDSSNA